MARNRLNS